MLQISLGISEGDRSTVPWIDQSWRREKPSAIARMTKGRASFAQTDSVAALVTDQADAASDDG